MFDHLDDANPIRAAVASRSRTLPRQRHLVTAATVLAVTVAALGVAVAVTRPGPKHAVVVATETPSTVTTTVPVGPSLACAALTPKAEGGLPSTPSPGTPRSATVRMGAVTARLDGTAPNDNIGDLFLMNPKLTVTDGTEEVRSDVIERPKGMLTTVGVPTAAVIPSAIGGTEPDAGELCLGRFASANRPAVILGLSTGGVHCCIVVRAFSLDRADPVEHNFMNPGATLAGGPDGALIMSGDNSFDYAFTDYADSAVPLTVYELSDGQFVDTTRHHLDLMGTDASKWRAAIDQPPSTDQHSDIRGVTAAWLADECLLGQSTSAFATIDQLNAQGRLAGPNGPDSWPAGSAYVTALKKLLTVSGYCAGGR